MSNLIIKALDDNKCPVLKCPMGAGKTNILPFFLSSLSKRNVIIMQPNKKLADQTYGDLARSL